MKGLQCTFETVKETRTCTFTNIISASRTGNADQERTGVQIPLVLPGQSMQFREEQVYKYR
jgi:hypothetical protein